MTGTRGAAAPLRSARTTHRIGRPLCLENPRPKGGNAYSLHYAPKSPLTATDHSRRGSRWPAEVAPSPAAANITAIVRPHSCCGACEVVCSNAFCCCCWYI